MNDLIQIERLAAALLQQTAPAARRKLLRSAARETRKSQSDRIAAQVQPDGSAFAPRKQQVGANSRKGRLVSA